MSLPKILLDTDTLSELFKEIDPNVLANAAQYQIEYSQLTFTSLSALEVLSGLERKQASAKLKRTLHPSSPRPSRRALSTRLLSV